ncbi:MAG TPA: PAS domain S-box protein [Candidatus Acidoferrales bacterium]|nr:PAS domain S-box protein [Candidatus Acidoferrales bacterium]
MKPPTIEPPAKDSLDPSAPMSPPLGVRKNMDEDMRYRALLEAAPDAIVVVNQSGKIVLVNEQAEKLFGYHRDELIGQPAEILISHHFRAQHSDQHSRLMAVPPERPTVVGLELFGLRKDGSEFPAEIRLSPLDTKEGIFVSSAIRDISGRSRTEEDLRRLASIVACSDDAIIGKTLEGIITSWNAGAERMYGYSAKEAIGKSVSMLVPIDQPDEIPEVLERVKRGATVDHFETIRVRKDGKEIQMELTVSPIRDAIERIVGVSTIGHDISARKVAEKRLVQMEARYRGLLEAAPDAMVVVNQAGEIVILNLQAEKQFGYRRDELLGQKVKNIIPEGFAERLLADGTRTAADALAQQIGTGIELIGRRKDGSEFPIEIMLSPLESAEGILVTAAIRNISTRRAAEKHLGQMEGKYRGLLEAAPDAMVVVNQGGEIVLLNVQAEKQFGYRRDELVGQKVKNIIPKGFAERLISDSTRTAADALAQQIGTGIELNGRRKDGSEFPIEIMLSPLESAEGILVTAAIRNISERKQLEQQLLQAQKMETVGRLAGGVAHDFNNLLGVIIGYSEIFEERLNLNDPLRPKAEQIRKAGESAAALTRQLLAFSRKQVLEPKVLNLNAVVADMLKMLQRLLGEDIELIAVPGPELGRIKADQGQIEQVIMNLAVNARDAMPQGGKLTITTVNEELDEVYARQHPAVVPGSYVMFAVSDTGCGMDLQTQTHIFEPFFTTKEIGKGTGLGLSTVYGVVKQSGGDIRVYSEPGRGATFRIYLPRIAEAVTPSDPGKGGSEIGRGWETILLVEDAQPLRALAHELLEGSGYTVLEAANGADAIRLAAQHQGPIHLLLTDVVMPGMDGPKVAAYMTRIYPGIKVLYASGYTDDAIVHHGVLDSGVALLHKPFTRAALTSKVREVLGLTGEHEIGSTGPGCKESR